MERFFVTICAFSPSVSSDSQLEKDIVKDNF
jgi:hypothetical protein